MEAVAAPGQLSFPAATADIRAAEWSVAGGGAAASHDARLSGLTGASDAAAWAARFHEEHPDTAPGPVRVCVVADSLSATFELEEILHALRDFAVSLQASPIAYLLDFVRVFSASPEYVLPDRRDISISTPCLDAYLRHLEAVSAKRQAPLKDVPERIRQVFDDDRPVEPADLLQVPRGRITESGIRANIDVVLRFMAGSGEVGRVDAEFAAAQLWQWVRHETGVLDNGRIISEKLVLTWLAEELQRLQSDSGDGDPGRRDLESAAQRLEAVLRSATLPESIDAQGYRRDA